LGRLVPSDIEADGSAILVRPERDLPGGAEWLVSVRGIEDRSGNRAERSWTGRLTTLPDRVPPQLVATFPAASATASPGLAAELRFDESVTLEQGRSPVEWTCGDGLSIAHEVVTSRDGRIVHLVPQERLPIGATCSLRRA